MHRESTLHQPGPRPGRNERAAPPQGIPGLHDELLVRVLRRLSFRPPAQGQGRSKVGGKALALTLLQGKRNFSGPVPLWTGQSPKIPIYRASPLSFISPPVSWPTSGAASSPPSGACPRARPPASRTAPVAAPANGSTNA